MRKRLFMLSIFVLLSCLPPVCAARLQGNSIRGKVRNSSGHIMPRVVVELQTGNGTPFTQAVTNNEGDFFFGGLTETSYVVTVSMPDYQLANERVEFVNRPDANTPGETRMVDLVLTPRGGDRIIPPRAAFAQNVPKAARAALDLGMRLSREGKQPEAVAAMQEAIKAFPDYFDARFALASEMIKANRLDEAIAELEQARRINPKDDRVYQAFGLVLSRQKKYAVAAAVFGEAARLNPADPQILLMRGTALVDYAATLDPAKSKEAAGERGRAFQMAEKDLGRALEMSGRKLAAVRLQLARLYEKKGERARAADELEQYLRATPDASNAAAIREAIKKLRAPAP